MGNEKKFFILLLFYIWVSVQQKTKVTDDEETII